MTGDKQTLGPASGLLRRSAPDHDTPSANGPALTELFSLYRGKPNEPSPAIFSWVRQSSGAAIMVALDGKAGPEIKDQAQRFLSMVAGASGDFKAGVKDDGIFYATETTFRWTLGINRMSGELARNLGAGRV